AERRGYPRPHRRRVRARGGGAFPVGAHACHHAGHTLLPGIRPPRGTPFTLAIPRERSRGPAGGPDRPPAPALDTAGPSGARDPASGVAGFVAAAFCEAVPHPDGNLSSVRVP